MWVQQQLTQDHDKAFVACCMFGLLLTRLIRLALHCWCA
jgi:hypothetical protein